MPGVGGCNHPWAWCTPRSSSQLYSRKTSAVTFQSNEIFGIKQLKQAQEHHKEGKGPGKDSCGRWLRLPETGWRETSPNRTSLEDSAVCAGTALCLGSSEKVAVKTQGITFTILL